MNSSIEQKIADLVSREGEYVDDPADKGGPTRWGVTEKVARAAGYTGSMRDYPLSSAKDLFAVKYWYEPRFSEVDRLSPYLAEELFDTGVNMGTATATRFLQRALNALDTTGPGLKADGQIGLATLAALKAYSDARGIEGLKVLTRCCDAQQAVRYLEIVEGDPKQKRFAYGWLRARTGELR